MFAIPTPYTANRHTVVSRSGKTFEEWQPCRVVGIDAGGDEPKYIVEIRSKDGSFYLDKADLIRKPAPSAA
ncbi:hypothetical protein PY650_30995 [Rhizobium calliandrae]|uniref:Uncharacterized protein n=1 Tax=Rhizobium calliandrae TaxID=1312182 RepID=A0ABT7KP95_9HYPH|nr:hypothetical protein [Rhizobium calliandrae]MDL2409967.1 hypothetical protein [Rhizobium calliandrae]